jgi:homoserine kinase type II
MALLSPLPFEDARRLAAEHGIELAAIEPLAAGSVNSNFRLTAAGGRVLFARIYEEQDLEGARREHALLGELAAAGVPTPRALLLAEHAGKPVAFFPWVDGTMRCQAGVTAGDCARLGEALARVHRAPVSRVPQGRFGVAELESRLDRIEREASAELVSAAGEIRQKLRDYAARRNPDLPSGLTHGDLFRDNVLWQGGRISALLDFESAAREPFLYDLMVTLEAWCFGERFDPMLVRAILSGYSRQRPLLEAELAAAPVEAALGALRFATTRITDYSMRAPPGAAPLRSFRRFLGRLAEIEAGALDSALAELR